MKISFVIKTRKLLRMRIHMYENADTMQSFGRNIFTRRKTDVPKTQTPTFDCSIISRVQSHRYYGRPLQKKIKRYYNNAGIDEV